MDGELTFGAWLKRRRRQLDLTQKGLAHLSGCSVGTIRKMEADERKPSRQLAGLMSECLEIPPDQREVFIAFARSEAYISDTPIPVLPAAEGQVPIIPQEAKVTRIKHNLPLAATPFVGREVELTALDKLLTSHDRRLVTIVGSGGIGKTRLALAYAGEQLEDKDGFQTLPYKDGVFFVDLTALTEVERLVFNLAEVLNLRIQAGVREKRSSKRQLLDYLRERRLLLVLDNFEHLLSPLENLEKGEDIDATSLVMEILGFAPEVRILVTSRERLNLQVEQVFAIEGLAYPDWKPPTLGIQVEKVCEYTAVHFFLQAAQRSRQDFILENEDELWALLRICNLTGGIPLALELAASWVDVLSLADIAAEVQHSLDFLETEMRGMPDRHHSMRATINSSWRKLDEGEQAVFAQLSIFQGGFTRQAAQAVVGASLRQLSQLANKSFIKYEKRHDRYRIHELLRQYGAECLSGDAELEQGLQDRHSRYYCQMVAGYTDALKSAGQPQAIVAIEADIENVRLAWNRAITRQDLDSIGIATESLHRFYHNKSWYSQGIKEFEMAVAGLRNDPPIDERGIILGRLLAFLGRFYADTLQRSKASETLMESLDLLQQLEARDETLVPLLFLADIRTSLEASTSLYTESLVIAREIDDQWAIGHALLQLGRNFKLAGDYEQAEQRYREAQTQFRKTGDLGAYMGTLSWLSDLNVDRGRYDEAVLLARECMSLNREYNPNFPIYGFDSMGGAMYAIGKFAEAEKLLQQGLALVRGRDLRSWVPHRLLKLGMIVFRQGDYERAEEYLQKSLAGALAFEELEDVVRNHEALGRLALEKDQVHRAREHLQSALENAIPLDRPPLVLSILTTTVELFAKEINLAFAALLATFVINHPASEAMVKERAEDLLTHLEEQFSADDLAEIRQRSQQSDLDSLAAQLVTDLEEP